MANANDVLDRVPELRDLLVDVLAFLMDLHDDESLTVTDVAARIPELDGLYSAVDDFLTELDDDDTHEYDLAEAVECLDATDDDDAWGSVETDHGAVFVGFPRNAADDEDE